MYRYEGGGGARTAASLRRSRSIHEAGRMQMNNRSRRNPYDYLPDEPTAQQQQAGKQTSVLY